MTEISEFARFWSKVDASGGMDACWPWAEGHGRSRGYGQFWLVDRMVPAHIWAYINMVGPIPEGLHLDHECHNADPDCVEGEACPHRACVNVFAHLEPKTPRENMLSGKGIPARNAAKTHCPQGHPLSGPNLYLRPTGQRACRICRAENMRRFYERGQPPEPTAE